MVLLFESAVFPARAAFSALYAFGDGACTTTGNTSGGDYYGDSYCNGRIWIQVLAQRQGLPYVTNNNVSYFGQYSGPPFTGQNPPLLSNVTNFTAPSNASSALFLIWVCDADSVYEMQNFYPYNNVAQWTNAMNQSVTNQLNAVQMLYNKGVRTLIMPNAVDVSEIPEYDLDTSSSDKAFIRARIIYFNTTFSSALRNLAATNAGLKIYVPDIFSLLDNVLTNAASYGLTNVLYGGQSIDALENLGTSTPLTGPGANYIFWDITDPTARFHEVIADYVQQFFSPAQISQVTPRGGSNQLNVINFPAGLNGFVDATTNLTPPNWQAVQSFTNTSTTQTLFVPVSGARQFYRLRLPYAWYFP
jgi:phospholipase/lecithinase/hemolysin